MTYLKGSRALDYNRNYEGGGGNLEKREGGKDEKEKKKETKELRNIAERKNKRKGN